VPGSVALLYRRIGLLSIVVEMLVGGSEATRRGEGRTVTVLDDALTRTVGRLSMGAALLLGAAIYVVIGLAVPLSIGAPGFLLVLLNVFGVVLGWLVTLAWIGPRVEAARRRHLLEWTTDLRLLSAQEFEWLVGEVLRREDWDVEETGREGAADGNVDLRIRRAGQELLVQCKRWESWSVGVDEVRKLAGTLMREGFSGDAGILVTLSHFTEQAIAEAAELGIKLVDNRELIRRIERVRATEACPNCAAPMVLDRSKHGWWLRCPGWPDGCPGKRDLGADPGRALDLLLAD
jgi:restriction system protein